MLRESVLSLSLARALSASVSPSLFLSLARVCALSLSPSRQTSDVPARDRENPFSPRAGQRRMYRLVPGAHVLVVFVWVHVSVVMYPCILCKSSEIECFIHPVNRSSTAAHAAEEAPMHAEEAPMQRMQCLPRRRIDSPSASPCITGHRQVRTSKAGARCVQARPGVRAWPPGLPLWRKGFVSWRKGQANRPIGQ